MKLLSLLAGIFTEVEPPLELFVDHGATAGTARPAGGTAIRVVWKGTVTPSNAIDGDRYINTAGTTPVTSVFSRTGAVVSANGDYTASQVTNVPAGSIAATTVQAAITELDGDQTTHAALTAAHGATGAVVGTTNTQTLTAKTLTSPIINTGVTGSAFGVYSTGSSFPGSPATDDRCYRTDRRIEYFYDGTRWLSTTLYAQPINTMTVAATTATVSFYAPNPWWNLYAIYVEKFKVGSQSTTTTAANYFVHQFGTEDAASPANVGSTISGLNNTQNQWIGQETSPNAVVASTVDAFRVTSTETGTSSTWITSSILYRLIG